MTNLTMKKVKTILETQKVRVRLVCQSVHTDTSLTSRLFWKTQKSTEYSNTVKHHTDTSLTSRLFWKTQKSTEYTHTVKHSGRKTPVCELWAVAAGFDP